MERCIGCKNCDHHGKSHQEVIVGSGHRGLACCHGTDPHNYATRGSQSGQFFTRANWKYDLRTNRVVTNLASGRTHQRRLWFTAPSTKKCMQVRAANQGYANSGITLFWRSSLKRSRNISSVSIQSGKPALRALIVLLMLSKPLWKIKSPKLHETSCS